MKDGEKREAYWQAFLKEGRVADYLRYRGVDIRDSTFAGMTAEWLPGGQKKGGSRGNDHRGADHTRE